MVRLQNMMRLPEDPESYFGAQTDERRLFDALLMTPVIKLVGPVNLCRPVQQEAPMRIVFIQTAASGVSQFICVPSGCGGNVGVTPPACHQSLCSSP